MTDSVRIIHLYPLSARRSRGTPRLCHHELEPRSLFPLPLLAADASHDPSIAFCLCVNGTGRLPGPRRRSEPEVTPRAAEAVDAEAIRAPDREFLAVHDRFANVVLHGHGAGVADGIITGVRWTTGPANERRRADSFRRHAADRASRMRRCREPPQTRFQQIFYRKACARSERICKRRHCFAEARKRPARLLVVRF